MHCKDCARQFVNCKPEQTNQAVSSVFRASLELFKVI